MSVLLRKGSRMDVANYRFISLMRVTTKIFDKGLGKVLRGYMEEHEHFIS